MSNRQLLFPAFIMALLAVIISLSTMFVYLHQVCIVSKQVRAAARSFLELIFPKSKKVFFGRGFHIRDLPLFYGRLL